MRVFQLSVNDFAAQIRMTPAAIRAALKPRRTERRNTFPLRTIAFGLTNGHERPALSLLFERKGEDIPAIQVAAFMYPDLRSCELAAIREEEGKGELISCERIRFLVNTIRTLYPIPEESVPFRNAA